MDMIENIQKQEDGTVRFQMDSDVVVIKFLIPLGFADLIQKSGYAHLIEHMIVQSNKKYLTYLEKQGIQFNAETKDSMTEYIFIELQDGILQEELDSGNLEEIFETEFEQKGLSIEKNTILQEHLLLCSRLDEAEVNEMIGSREEIEEFELNKAKKIHEGQEGTYSTIIFGKLEQENREDARLEKMIFEEDWIEKVSFEEIIRQDNKVEIHVKKDRYGEVLSYCLRILFCGMVTDYALKIVHKSDIIKIVLEGNIRQLREVNQYKENAYHHYYLLLTSFKYLCNEVTYVTRYLEGNPDIEKTYFQSDWEEKLCDKIFKKEVLFSSSV